MTTAAIAAWVLFLAAVLALLPLCSDIVSLVRRAGGPVRKVGVPEPAPCRLGFVIPAHNEAALIQPAVRALRLMRHGRSLSRIWVIADNCTDRTAALAREAGAEVLEREQPAEPGKPAAIRWALPHLAGEPLDAIVVVDADTLADEGLADGLALHGPLREKAVQAYFATSNADETWLTRLGALFAQVRYEGQFALKQAVGLNVVLTGNGMCLGTGLISRQGLATTALTEDLELYARFTAAGERIDFAPEAVVRAQEAGSLAETTTQRRRWQAGRWQVFRRALGLILLSQAIGPRQKLDALAEVCFPGPVAHTALALTLAAVSLAVTGSSGQVLATLFLVSTLPTLGWTVWALRRRTDRGPMALALLRLPGYALWRLGLLFAAALTGLRGRWERSPRRQV